MNNLKKKTKIIFVGIPGKDKFGFPLGLYNLQGYLLKYKPAIKVKLVILKPHAKQIFNDNYYPTFSVNELKKTAEKIVKQKPKIIGFSCYVWNIKTMLKIVSLVKRKRSDAIIVLGGPEASCNAKRLLKKNNNIDYIVIDEGEEKFLKLLENIENKKKRINSIQGLRRHRPLSLKKIPSPYLMGLVNLKKEKNVILETSRGCPFKCAYCSYNIRNYAVVRYYALKKIKREIKYILQNEVKELSIIDDNFNLHEIRAKEILKTIIKHNKKTKTRFFIRADIWPLSRELVFLLKKAHSHLMIGVQSINPKTLQTAQRVNNFLRLEDNLRALDKNKIIYELQFIIGLPGDKYQDIKKEIDWIFSFRPRKVVFQLLRINPDTEFAKNAVKFGLKYSKKPPYIISKSKNMSKKDLIKASMLTAVVSSFISKQTNNKKLDRYCKQLGMSYSDFFELWLKQTHPKIFM